MSHPEESKTAANGGEATVPKRNAFPSTALRAPTLAALKRGVHTAGSPFPSTALREPMLRLAAAERES